MSQCWHLQSRTRMMVHTPLHACCFLSMNHVYACHMPRMRFQRHRLGPFTAFLQAVGSAWPFVRGTNTVHMLCLLVWTGCNCWRGSVFLVPQRCFLVSHNSATVVYLNEAVSFFCLCGRLSCATCNRRGHSFLCAFEQTFEYKKRTICRK
jgi:hypothetical protein